MPDDNDQFSYRLIPQNKIVLGRTMAYAVRQCTMMYVGMLCNGCRVNSILTGLFFKGPYPCSLRMPKTMIYPGFWRVIGDSLFGSFLHKGTGERLTYIKIWIRGHCV